MSMKVDLGNTQKVYGAKYAIDSSYCYNFSEVGLSTDKSESPIYKNKGFFGFGVESTTAITAGIVSTCKVIGGLDAIQFISSGDGTCSDADIKNKEACDGDDTWTERSNTIGVNAATCALGTNAFVVGAYSDVSSLNTLIQGNHDGVIIELSGVQTCDFSKF